MIKAGFICEGFTERYLLESQSFKSLLASFNIQALPVINAQGAGNLLPHNISGYLIALQNQKAEIIFIVTDLDQNACITLTKERVRGRMQDIIIVAVRTIEAWFLASTRSMCLLLSKPTFFFENPEDELQPFETIRKLLLKHTGRGIENSASGKIKLIKRLIDNGIDLNEAAQHPNCPSAKYFISKLSNLNNT